MTLITHKDSIFGCRSKHYCNSPESGAFPPRTSAKERSELWSDRIWQLGRSFIERDKRQMIFRAGQVEGQTIGKISLAGSVNGDGCADGFYGRKCKVPAV